MSVASGSAPASRLGTASGQTTDLQAGRSYGSFFAGIQPVINKAEKAAARTAMRGEPSLSWFDLPAHLFRSLHAEHGRHPAHRRHTEKHRLDDALNEYAAVSRLLETLENRIEVRSADSAIWSWIQLVRSELANPLDTLVSSVSAEDGGGERPLSGGPMADPSSALARPRDRGAALAGECFL